MHALSHRDFHRLAAETQHQPFAFGFQVQNHAGVILQPEIACALEPVLGLPAGTWELRDAIKLVHLTRSIT
jgi:hypothetical protein